VPTSALSSTCLQPADGDLRPLVVEPVLALELVGDGALQLDPPIEHRVARLAAVDRGDCRLADIGWRVEVGLVLRQADDVAPGQLQFGGERRHRRGWRGFDAGRWSAREEMRRLWRNGQSRHRNAASEKCEATSHGRARFARVPSPLFGSSFEPADPSRAGAVSHRRRKSRRRSLSPAPRPSPGPLSPHCRFLSRRKDPRSYRSPAPTFAATVAMPETAPATGRCDRGPEVSLRSGIVRCPPCQRPAWVRGAARGEWLLSVQRGDLLLAGPQMAIRAVSGPFGNGIGRRRDLPPKKWTGGCASGSAQTTPRAFSAPSAAASKLRRRP
jgi:hypothetical protein